MIKKFLLERRSWILLFLFIQLLIICVSYVDSTISLYSSLYIVFLSLLTFTFFLIYRYQKETSFYRSLMEREKDLDMANIELAQSPFEKMVEQSIVDQTKLLKQVNANNRLALEQEKDDLLAWIHDVKTPLTAMHLIIDRLEGEEKKQLTYEWLRIHLLLDQQLHQRRIPFLENDLYIEEVDLSKIIFQEIKTLQTWCIQKGIGFEVDLKVEKILCDTKWLSFIIRQLLTNAVKYSESQEIEIKTKSIANQTVLMIKDYGRGIDAKDLPRIFDKGFTSTTKRQDTRATGMGLYLTKKVADSLFIQIDVQSQLEVGTTFTLTFPNRNEFHLISGM